MHEFELINNYFSKIAKQNKFALDLNDDVFFDKIKGVVISVDTYVNGSHFIDFKYPDLVIKKILRSSISDLIGNKKVFTKNNLIKISKSLNNEQKKYQIYLCGGDTTVSDKLSFTIISLGYSKKIVFRNKAKIDDDIYVTGNLGDSFIGLQILKKKLKANKTISKYFIKKYFEPNIQIRLAKYLLKFANTSIDISDGILSDLNKLINRQNLSFKIYEKKIPISKKLDQMIKNKKLKKIKLVSNGDDYQILFTANKNKSRIINHISRITGIKISKIGKITSSKNKSLIITHKNEQIEAKNLGYIHQF